jgi:hypothetical protein
MSLEDSNVIDFVSLDPTGNVFLTISDHLAWDVDNEHLLLLQEKINAYLSSIESGDLYDKYPKAKGRKIIINLSTKYLPNEEGYIFLKKVKTMLEAAGYEFQYQNITGQK